MTSLRTWFDARSLREKWLLIGMAALAAVTLAWAAVLLPLGDALSSARERHADAVVRLGATETRLAALAAAQANRPAPVTGTLDAAVRAEAEAAGFALAGLVPAGDGVTVTIASAKPGALTRWLAQLERRGVLVDEAAMTDNGDRTVHATLTLSERAA